VDVEVLTTATTVLFLAERNNHWCYSFIAYRCRTLKLCCSYAVFKTVSSIARPHVRGRLFRAATTSPYFWPMGGGSRPVRPCLDPPMPNVYFSYTCTGTLRLLHINSTEVPMCVLSKMRVLIFLLNKSIVPVTTATLSIIRW